MIKALEIGMDAQKVYGDLPAAIVLSDPWTGTLMLSKTKIMLMFILGNHLNHDKDYRNNCKALRYAAFLHFSGALIDSTRFECIHLKSFEKQFELAST